LRFKRGSLDKFALIFLIFISILILTFNIRESNDGILHKTQIFTVNSLASLQSGVSKIVYPFYHAWEYVSDIGCLKAENKRLKNEVVELKQEIISMRNMQNENKRLRKLVGFKEKTHYSTSPARIIGRSANNWQSTLIIDKGSDNGINKNMPVMVGEGLVGQVVAVSSRVAQVQLITDQKSGVASQLLISGETGIVEGQVTGELLMNYIDKDIKISKNEPVLTSGLGGVFPKGLFVGTVNKTKETPYDLYKQVWVKSHVNFSNIEEVLIITDILPTPSFLSEEGD